MGDSLLFSNPCAFGMKSGVEEGDVEGNVPVCERHGFMRQASTFTIKYAKHWEANTCMKQL